MSGAKCRTIFCPSAFFGSHTSTISRFGECFRDGKYSSVSFLFAVLLLKVPPCSGAQPTGGGGAQGAQAPSETLTWNFECQV